MDERTHRIEEYVNRWIKARYIDWNLFYHDAIRSKRTATGIYSLKGGNKLMDTLDNIIGNIEAVFASEDGHLVPERFPSSEFLVQSLQRFANLVKPSEKILRSNIKGDDEYTNPIVWKIYGMISDIEEMARVCTDILGMPKTKTTKPYMNLLDALLNEDIDSFIAIISSLIESIPYNIRKEKINEGYFHTLFHILLAFVGFEPISEGETANGRIDVSLTLPEIIYIFEFKYTEDDRDKSEEALNQIKTNGYASAKVYLGKKIMGIGVSFSGADGHRNINGVKSNILFEK